MSRLTIAILICASTLARADPGSKGSGFQPPPEPVGPTRDAVPTGGSGFAPPPEPPDEPIEEAKTSPSNVDPPVRPSSFGDHTERVATASADYMTFSLGHAESVYSAQYYQTWIIFFVVLAIVFAGLVLTWKYGATGTASFARLELRRRELAIVQEEFDKQKSDPLKARIERLTKEIADLDPQTKLIEMQKEIDASIRKGSPKHTVRALERSLEKLQAAGSKGDSHTLGIGTAGINVSTKALGVVVLALSLGFFFLYLRYVYPINNNAQTSRGNEALDIAKPPKE